MIKNWTNLNTPPFTAFLSVSRSNRSISSSSTSFLFLWPHTRGLTTLRQQGNLFPGRRTQPSPMDEVPPHCGTKHGHLCFGHSSPHLHPRGYRTHRLNRDQAMQRRNSSTCLQACCVPDFFNGTPHQTYRGDDYRADCSFESAGNHDCTPTPRRDQGKDLLPEAP